MGDLQLQMSRADFNTWLKDTVALSQEDGIFVIGVPTPFAKEWLENRLSSIIRRTLTRILGYSVEVRFVIHQRVPETPSLLPYLEPATPRQDHVSTEPADSAPEQYTQAASPFAAAGPVPRYRVEATPGLVTEPQPGANHVLNRPTASSPMIECSLNPRYTFDNFVVGSSNRLAHAACLAVVAAPAQKYNPLFLYGGVGLGKTHLLHAIGHAARQKGLAVLYVSSERFTNELINAIREQQTEAFRNKYRSVDILLVDDIQFIAGKEATQEEFFHTFNTLHDAAKQIVVSSDRPPKAIIAMEDRLRSRLEWGLIADIQPPDLEMRIAILQQKARAQQLDVPQDVIEFIAQHVQSNIRELEGSLNRVVAYATIRQIALTLDVAKAALGDVLLTQQRATPAEVIAAVCRYYRIAPEILKGKQRDKEIVLPRQVAMYLLRTETDASLPQIGEELGGRDHSTILHGCSKIANDMQVDDQLRRDIVAIRSLLYPSPTTL